MADFLEGYDAATKWAPPPDWATATVVANDWSARPLPGLYRLLVSGDISAAVSTLAPGCTEVGVWGVTSLESALLRIGRDRALMVSTQRPSVTPRWHPSGFAISTADDAWMTLAISGEGAERLIREMTSVDLEGGSPSAACLLCGLSALLHRDPDRTAMIHVETGHAPYLWRWLELRGTR